MSKIMTTKLEKFLKDTGSALIYNSGEGQWEILEPWTLRGTGEVLARAGDIKKLEKEAAKLTKPGLIETALSDLVNFTFRYRNDPDYPFFSEGCLYSKIGKDDARTVLAYLHRLCKVLGFDLYKLQNRR